jgi:hypothetical protein
VKELHLWRCVLVVKYGEGVVLNGFGGPMAWDMFAQHFDFVVGMGNQIRFDMKDGVVIFL